MRAAIRRSDAESYILTSLVASAATVIVTRVFLELAAYPQLGNSILHIALALWGGLLLFVVTGFRGLGLALREVGNERNPPVPIDNAVVLCEVMRALDARMAGTFREVLSHTACGRLRFSVERIVRSAVGWRERAMREVGHMLRVYVTTACVALTLVTGGAVSTDSGATQPVDGLYAQGTKRQRGASGSDLWSPALPPVCSSCSCSTFMLFTDESFLVGHNLDNGRPVPGTIVVNKRNVQKTGVSLHELLFGVEPPNPAITWTSRYGSITFNAWGKEFIDGGINEVGLYIHEMSLLGTRFPEDDERPRMFMMQWMQYQLDNYATVEEVLSNLSTIVLDGWFWHFFVSDREGNTAAIEFVDGVLTVYTGDSMPIPVLCNRAYPEELANLERYAGFGGEQPVRLRDKRTERFVHAAHMIQ
ncbi:MAG: linear amide C-N hydrolase, partial [Anaerolineae bacterium]